MLNNKLESCYRNLNSRLLRLVMDGDGHVLRGLAVGSQPIFVRRSPNGEDLLLQCAPTNWPELSHDLLITFDACFSVELLPPLDDHRALDFVCRQARNAKMFASPLYWKAMHRMYGKACVVGSVTAGKWPTEGLRVALMDHLNERAKETLNEVAEIMLRPPYPWRGLSPRLMSRRELLGYAHDARVFDIGLLLETVHQNDEARLREPVTDSQW